MKVILLQDVKSQGKKVIVAAADTFRTVYSDRFFCGHGLPVFPCYAENRNHRIRLSGLFLHCHRTLEAYRSALHHTAFFEKFTGFGLHQRKCAVSDGALSAAAFQYTF